MEQQKFEVLCLVELFGHTRVAGKVSEQTIAGAGMLRIDVPETKHNPAFTRFVNPSAVYALNPMDELTMKQYAEDLQVKPIDVWDVHKFVAKINEQKALSGAREPAESDLD